MTGRFRTTDTRKNLSNWQWWSYGNPYSPSATGANGQVGQHAEMWDVTIPKFKERSKNGEVIMNPMSRMSVTRQLETLSLYRHHTGNPAQWAEMRVENNVTEDLSLGLGFNAADASQYDLIPSSDIDKMITEACTQCISKRNRASTESWENIAEVRKTIAMFRHPLDSFYKYERHWKRNVLRGATLTITPENAYLMYRYGVRPLVTSLKDILESLAKRTKPRYSTTRGVSTLTRESNVTSTIIAGGYLYKEFGIQKTESVQVRAVSVDEWVQDMYYDMGISQKELFTLPWAMVPYSFVVDWLLNVSDFIGAMADATLLRQPMGECFTVQRVRSEVRASRRSWHQNTSLVQTSQCLSRARTDSVQKWRSPTLATPGLVFKADFGFDEATRVADALALIAQQTVGRIGPLLSVSRKFWKGAWF